MSSKKNKAPKSILHIDLGDGHRLEWEAFSPYSWRFYELDELVKPLDPLWNHLETICVSVCCGIEAFDFTRQNIDKIRPYLDTASTKKSIIGIASEVREIRQDVVAIGRLNTYLRKDTFLQLLDHLQRHL